MQNTILSLKLLLIMPINTYSMLQKLPINKPLTLSFTSNVQQYKGNTVTQKIPLNTFCQQYCSITEKDFNAIYKALEQPITPDALRTLLDKSEYNVTDIKKIYDYNGKQLVSYVDGLTESSMRITWFKIVAGIHVLNLPIFMLAIKLQEVEHLQLLGEIINKPSAIILMSSWLVLCYQMPFLPFWFVSKKHTENQLSRVQQNHHVLRSILVDLEKKDSAKMQSTGTTTTGTASD